MSDTFEAAIKALENLQPFITYLEGTDEDEWQVDVVRSVGNTKNCLFGHLVNWYHGKDWEGSVTKIWDCFEEMWATTYQIYPINDGQSSKYRQATPKQRTIAYLKDLWLGLEVPTWRGMEIEADRRGL